MLVGEGRDVANAEPRSKLGAHDDRRLAVDRAGVERQQRRQRASGDGRKRIAIWRVDAEARRNIKLNVAGICAVVNAERTGDRRRVGCIRDDRHFGAAAAAANDRLQTLDVAPFARSLTHRAADKQPLLLMAADSRRNLKKQFVVILGLADRVASACARRQIDAARRRVENRADARLGGHAEVAGIEAIESVCCGNVELQTIDRGDCASDADRHSPCHRR